MSKKNETKNGITLDDFVLSVVKEMSFSQAKKAIDKHFVILNTGDHAMIVKGTVKLYDKKTIKDTYFNRLSIELQNYYFKEKTDIRTVIFDIHKPFLTDTELNLSEKMMHKYQPYSSFSEEIIKNVDLMIEYVKEVLCAGREDILQHLLKLEANMVRGIKNDCCIYLKGSQGIGKSTHPEFLRFHVMGQGLCIESGSAPLKNRFNSELKGKVMTIFEELENFGPSEWISISSTLKRWITSQTMQIEGKNKDVIEVINMMTFWLLSNNDAIQDDEGRRYFILPVSAKYMDDHKYFGNLRNKCFNNEVGHAYYCKLMEINLDGFQPQMYPLTSAKLDSFSKRLDSVYKFVKDMFVLHRVGIDKIKVGELYKLYVSYCVNMQIKSKHKQDFNKMLEEVGIMRDKKSVYYEISQEDLKKIADKKHWVHELDEYAKSDTKEKYFGKHNDEDDDELEKVLNEGVDKRDQSVDQAIEWKKKYNDLEIKYKLLENKLQRKKQMEQINNLDKLREEMKGLRAFFEDKYNLKEEEPSEEIEIEIDEDMYNLFDKIF